MIPVHLTWAEIALAAQGGLMRRINALKQGLPGRYGATPDSATWDDDINACLGEYAAAKHFGLFWSPTVGITNAKDVGPYEIRSKFLPDHRLVIHTDDPDDDIFVSVYVHPPQFALCGWLLAKDAKRPEWILTPKGRPPMYFVANQDLLPIDSIPKNPLKSPH